MTVVFFGTSDYCLPVLGTLDLDFDLRLIVTRPDRPVGRKKILTPSPTKLWAGKNDVPVETSLSDLGNLRNLSDFDLGVVADFGQIIPEEIFSRPKLGTFNIHFSKLPDLRGASPVQSALLRGDTTAWVTIFKLEKTLDTGPILWQKSYPIGPDETAKDLYTRLFVEVAKELPTIFLKPETWTLTPQSGTPTFCKKLSRDDGFVEWKELQQAVHGMHKFTVHSENHDEPSSTMNPAYPIYNNYRAYFPWPGIWSTKDGRRVKILKCHLEKNKLILDQIQFEGEKPQNA